MATKTEKKHRGVYEKDPGTGIWWVRYTADGKIKREKVGRKSDAINLYQQRKSEIRAGVKMPANMRSKGETVSALIDKAITWATTNRPKSAHTSKQQMLVIEKELGARVAADLKPSDVEEWLTAHESWTNATKNRYKSALSKALQLAVIDGHLTRNVARLVTAKEESSGRVRYLKTDEEARIVSVIREECPEQLPAFYVALNTGMRSSEQFGLTWTRVDFQRRKILLEITKNGDPREIPMNKTVLALLEDLYTHRKGPFVFPIERKYKDDKRSAIPQRWFTKIAIKAKVDDFHWHDARHTFASRLVMAGVDLLTVSKLMGHKTVSMTARYAHLSPEHNLSAVEVLDAK
jgi:integrase